VEEQKESTDRIQLTEESLFPGKMRTRGAIPKKTSLRRMKKKHGGGVVERRGQKVMERIPSGGVCIGVRNVGAGEANVAIRK